MEKKKNISSLETVTERHVLSEEHNESRGAGMDVPLLDDRGENAPFLVSRPAALMIIFHSPFPHLVI